MEMKFTHNIIIQRKVVINVGFHKFNVQIIVDNIFISIDMCMYIFELKE